MIEVTLNALDGEDVRSLAQTIHNLQTGNTNDVSDGYHTFGELYQHRTMLWILIVKYHVNSGGRAYKFHHYDGWFVLGIETADGQISYHVPESQWGLCDFVTERTVEFDGHTSDDVLHRLRERIANF